MGHQITTCLHKGVGGLIYDEGPEHHILLPKRSSAKGEAQVGRFRDAANTGILDETIC